jgi:hypothetical protein
MPTFIGKPRNDLPGRQIPVLWSVGDRQDLLPFGLSQPVGRCGLWSVAPIIATILTAPALDGPTG